MSGEQQLERSVLEAKERDELQAIAEAMGLKPSSRAAKATLVGQILRATGVEDADPPPARARSRSRAPGPNGSEGTAAAEAAAGVSANGPEPSAPEAAPSGAEAAPAGPATVDPVEAADATDDRPVPASANGDAGPDRPPGPAADEAGHGGGGDDRQPREAQAGGGGWQGRTQQGRDTQHRPPSHNQAQGQGQPQGQPGAGAGAGQGANNLQDPANRRSRRRRGRDRTDRPGAERGDLQGGQDQPQFSGEPVPVSGLLDLNDQGYGFLRTSGYVASQRDVYVSISQVRRFALRKGDHVEGASRPAGSSEKYPALVRIDTVSGLTPDEARVRPRFEDLTPLFPDEKLRLEVPGDQSNMVSRIVDLISPIGKGQRGLIVSPPKAGKTTVLKQIAHSIEANNPEVHLMVLLVDERPEEVTDMRRSVQGEVVASTFDRPSEEHTAVAELAIDRAKRLVELGRDVVIVLDGITRLARAYNLAAPASGRILSGGVDANALYPPKRFFGAARNIEEGGSLTILATALVETGSRMDEVIFEEFKGTGNMELRLDRRLAERRIYPAIDVNGSSTRHEELLFERVQLQQVWKLRRVLQALGSEGSAAAGLELLMDKIKTTKSNDEFLAEIAKGPTVPV
ncbi:MAG: transcription termination factor Rho [Actinomycetota bacterium]